jgi:toxin-antitoxin system PIN domain toxin
VILPDLNLLLYAYNPRVPQHAVAHAWWTQTISDTEMIGLPHEVSLGFIRIATNRRLGAAAVDLATARETVELWLGLPHVRVLLPGPTHFLRVLDLMEAARVTGATLSDAILAAHAIENRATLFSNDADFSRFPGLRWHNPLAGLHG